MRERCNRREGIVRAFKGAGSSFVRFGAAISALVLPASVHAQTAAGSRITNIAQMRYTAAEGEASVSSNESSLVVAERLDVTLTRTDDAVLPVDNGGAVLPLVLTNTGNGQEAFAIAARTDASGGRIATIAIDANGDGRFDAATDTVLADGRTPVLAPGASVRLVLVADGLGASGNITASATAATGSGAPATEFTGQGDGGGDAVVGPTGAAASVTAPFGQAGSAPQLNKSAVVLAPDGTSHPVRGATITYTLEARFPGAVSGVVIADPVPAGTSYRAGSLTLDGTALSDAEDGDAGRVDAGGIAVALGTIPGGATRTIRFQVTIQ